MQHMRHAQPQPPPVPEPPKRPPPKVEDEATAAKRRKYACTWSGCGKTFTTSGNLCRHRALHLSIQPFRCPIEGCPMRFSRADSLRDHHASHLRRLAVQGKARAV
ncbi:hypothetical protein DFJ74DRAFT_674781 [Hyaloraphidium curvatum]|nr:hypothetical protein DFJ74DRAFT_674781 [Hyaloraphidium curvatum]